jgi:hypothetical protein
METKGWLRGSLITIVLIHLLVVLWRASAHTDIPVTLTASQTAFVSLVILMLPLIGGVTLFWRSRGRLAAWLITVWFVAIRPRLSLPGCLSRLCAVDSFVLSAALLAVTETMGSMLGLLALLA